MKNSTDKIPTTKKTLGFFSAYELSTILSLNFLTLAEITRINTAVIVDKSKAMQHIHRFFHERIDKDKRAAVKAKIVRYIELGDDREAKEMQLKHHIFIEQESELFKANLERSILIATFLRHVAHGQEQEAITLLKTDPTLLLETGSIVDNAGRSFNCITAFQYAQWSLDAHMANMLVQHIPEGDAGIDIKKALFEQGQALMKNGVGYELCRARSIYSAPTEADKRRVIERKEFLIISNKNRKHRDIEIGYCDNNRYKTVIFNCADNNYEKINTLMGELEFYNHYVCKDEPILDCLDTIKMCMSSIGIKTPFFCNSQYKVDPLINAMKRYVELYKKWIPPSHANEIDNLMTEVETWTLVDNEAKALVCDPHDRLDKYWVNIIGIYPFNLKVLVLSSENYH